jgi:SPP1 family predicted phage head-tail adaptor
MPSASDLRKAGGAAELRHRVTFAKPNQVADEYGNVTTGWLDMFTVWSNITPRLGGETVEAARLAGRQPAVFRVRQSPDTLAIRVDWKVTDLATGTPYNIRSVNDPHYGDVERGKYIDCLAESGISI